MRSARTHLVAAAVVAGSLGGCERGCLSGWSSAPGGNRSSLASQPATGLNAVDCADGAIRCRGGRAQASLIGSVAAACVALPEQPGGCDCPFVSLETCTHGCAAEDVEMAGLPSEAARTCAAAPIDAHALAPAPDARAVGCEGEGAGFRCQYAQVFACVSGSAAALAACAHGCYREGEELDDPAADATAAIALLCRAERPTRGP